MLAKKPRKEKRKQSTTPVVENTSLKLGDIRPKTKNQSLAFKDYSQDKTLFLHGLPGTGKTFIALYLALRSVLVDKTHRKVVIVRSAVPTRDIGFMPGTAAQKMAQYEAPYSLICTELFGRGDAYEVLKQRKVVEFIPTSFIRGITINDAIMIVDEAQNMDFSEVRSVITRLGENSRLVICGDRQQDDLTSERYREESGIIKLMNIMQRISDVSFIEYGVDDILRSDFIKRFILAEYGLSDPKVTSIHSLPNFITGS